MYRISIFIVQFTIVQFHTFCNIILIIEIIETKRNGGKNNENTIV